MAERSIIIRVISKRRGRVSKTTYEIRGHSLLDMCFRVYSIVPSILSWKALSAKNFFKTKYTKKKKKKDNRRILQISQERHFFCTNKDIRTIILIIRIRPNFCLKHIDRLKKVKGFTGTEHKKGTV